MKRQDYTERYKGIYLKKERISRDSTLSDNFLRVVTEKITLFYIVILLTFEEYLWITVHISHVT